MLNCENCCHCRFGNDIVCPFYKANLESTEIDKIKVAHRKDYLSKLYLAVCFLYGHRVAKNEHKAISILKSLVRKKYIPAKYFLSLCYFDGIKFPKNPEKAFEICKEAANQGCNLAEIKMYECYRDGIGTETDLKEARVWCGHAAGHKSKELYIVYADMCRSNKYGEVNIKDACRYYRKAYEEGITPELSLAKLKELHQNYIEECFRASVEFASGNEQLGDFCVNNDFIHLYKEAIHYYKVELKRVLEKIAETEKSEKETENTIERNCGSSSGPGMYRDLNRYKRYANEMTKSLEKYGIKSIPDSKDVMRLEEKISNCYLQYFNKTAADKKTLFEKAVAGDTEAQKELGSLFRKKDFELYDLTESMRWYRLSAEQGNSVAQFLLGNCYYYGDVGEPNYTEAAHWYKKAAEQDVTTAQERLGVLYAQGLGVKQSIFDAIKYYHLAAQKGSAIAQYNLGYCYFTDDNPLMRDYNYKEAVKWYTLAADQNCAVAQNNLAGCYFYGYGVDIDYDKAKELYEISAKNGCEKAMINLKTCIAKMED